MSPSDIIIIILSSVIVLLSTLLFYYWFRHRNIIGAVTQLIVDKEVLLNKLEIANLENSKQVNDGFIKFLSDSRESAFSYIEDVQTAIENYLVATENGNADEIATARMELFSHLPEDSENQSK